MNDSLDDIVTIFLKEESMFSELESNALIAPASYKSIFQYSVITGKVEKHGFHVGKN